LGDGGKSGGARLAVRWMGSPIEHVTAAGWCSYSGLLATKPDEQLDLAEIERLLSVVVKGIGAAQNRERYTMNGFVIAAGSYVEPVRERAKGVARAIGEVKVNMGETACKVPLASAAIEKASGSAKRKRYGVELFLSGRGDLRARGYLAAIGVLEREHPAGYSSGSVLTSSSCWISSGES